MRRLVVAMTGATGAALGINLLSELKEIDDVETHLIVSKWARVTIKTETGLTVRDVNGLADVVYSSDDQAAAISSGSFPVDSMVIVPCTMKTLAGVRSGYADGLIGRAADVTLKERRRLVVVPRETPLSEVHLENMLALARMGASIVPPVPAFYNRPGSVQEVIDHIVLRILDQLGLGKESDTRWRGVDATRGGARLEAVHC